MYTCPECGQLAEMNNNTCEHCGVGVKICPECGTALDASAEICDFCGISLDASKNIVSSIATATPVAPVQEEKTEPSNMEKLKEQEQKLAHYAEDCMKPFSIISKISSIFAALILIGSILLLFVPLIGGIDSSFAADMLGVGVVINIAFFFGFFLLLLSDFFTTFAPFFTARKIASMVEKEGFDYQTYYKEMKVYKRVRGALEESEHGEGAQLLFSMPTNSIMLVQALSYRDKPSAVVPKIIKFIISFFFNLTATIFIVLGVNSNLALLSNIAITGSTTMSTSDFINTSLIIGGVIYIIGAIICAIIEGCSNNTLKWIYDIKESN